MRLRTDTADWMAARGTAVVLIVLSLLACGAPSSPPSAGPDVTSGPNAATPDVTASGGPPSPNSADSAAPSGPTFPPDDPRSISEDIFTATSDPLELETTLDDANAVTVDLGPDGGEVSATATDGTSYTLTIPKDALFGEVPISVTPITEQTGFPNERPPETSLGVVLKPEGLVLAEPATLVIEPSADLPETDIVALEFAGTGTQPGFHVFEQTADAVTVSVSHFSGYSIVFPFLVDAARPSDLRQFFTQGEVEQRLASEIAFYMTLLRQLQVIGRDPPWNVADIARSALSLYKRLVIAPRVGVADRSCVDAHLAMLAYLEWQQQRQLLGVAEDPEFELVGAGMFVPADLVDLAVRVCFKEAYERCAKTSDFPSLGQYYLSFFKFTANLGVEPTQEALSLAQDYLRSCGRWRVRLATTIYNPDVNIAPYTNEATREFHVQWEPSDGVFGIIGSRITGHGEVDQTKITHEGACLPATITDIKSGRDSEAEITGMEFDHYSGPTLTGDVIPPRGRSLKLKVNLGIGLHDIWCNKPNGSSSDDLEEEFEAMYVVMAQDQGIPMALEDLLAIDSGDFASFIRKGWMFEVSPYRAVTVIEGRWDIATGPGGHAYQDGRLEVVVEHEPQ